MANGKATAMWMVKSVHADEPFFRAHQSGNLIRNSLQNHDTVSECGGDPFDGNGRADGSGHTFQPGKRAGGRVGREVEPGRASWAGFHRRRC